MLVTVTLHVFVCRYMTQKLFAFAKGKCCAESCDNPMFQDVLLAGHLYQNVLKVLNVFTCVGWKVTLCDPIWQVTLRGCEMDFH